jgi:molybdopterin-guanine dinucleotide biosynthesis protein A
MSAAPLFGLVLAGGQSSRMGRDKAALTYGGDTPQLERAMALLTPQVERAFVSVRADQAEEPLRARYPLVRDRATGLGPIAGLLAAQQEHPEAAWLVLACDLPLLDAATLTNLRRARDPRRTATAYRSSHDGLPEPLCAIYEPRSREPLAAHVAGGRNCPRKFLLGADTLLLDEPNPQALDNINTPAEYGSAMQELQRPEARAPRPLTVHYYALLREQAGRSEEQLVSTARTPRELYQELAQRHPFTLTADLLRVAVNAEFAEWTVPLAAGDVVVFLPPVAGG